MAKFSYTLLFITAVLLAGVPQFSGQSMSPGAAPTPAVDCMPYFLNVSDCLTFVSPGSNLNRPDPGCCTEFAMLVDVQPICLCQLLGNSTAVPVPVDIKRGLQLPNICNVTTPPPSACAVVGISIPPTSSPSASQSAGPSVSPSLAPSPGGAEVPSPTPSTTDADVPSPASGVSGPTTTISPSPRNEADSSTQSNSAPTKHFMIGSAAALLMYFI